jgi:cytochrome c peroxidase
MMKYLLYSVLFIAIMGCDEAAEEVNEDLLACRSIAGLEMDIPANNPTSIQKMRLGARLFFEPLLSRDSSVSCGSCHLKKYAFSDTVAFSGGVGDKHAARNSPSLVNVGYLPHLMAEGGVKTLELQVIAPLENEDEMDLGVLEACKRLNSVPYYQDFFQRVWGDSATPFTLTRSLAAFERTIVGGSSDYDRFLTGDSAALSSNARKGMDLFFSERLSCKTCHDGPLFTNFEMQNNGLDEEYADNGLFRLSLDAKDIGKFKVPSLRNVSKTYPYMHDGRFRHLEEVIDHYSSGGQSHPNKHAAIRGFKISQEERNQLVAFLESLTDQEYQ